MWNIQRKPQHLVGNWRGWESSTAKIFSAHRGKKPSESPEGVAAGEARHSFGNSLAHHYLGALRAAPHLRLVHEVNLGRQHRKKPGYCLLRLFRFGSTATLAGSKRLIWETKKQTLRPNKITGSLPDAPNEESSNPGKGGKSCQNSSASQQP